MAHTKCGLYLLASSLAAALLGTRRVLGREAVLADSGRAGEVAARAGRVRSLAFLSILRECSLVVPHERTIEVFACQNDFSVAFLVLYAHDYYF